MITPRKHLFRHFFEREKRETIVKNDFLPINQAVL